MNYTEEVQVTAYYYSHGDTKRSFPRRIELPEGRQINFIESGLRCMVKKGQDLLQVFNMTDGELLYRLGFDTSDQTWKLLSTRSL